MAATASPFDLGLPAPARLSAPTAGTGSGAGRARAYASRWLTTLDTAANADSDAAVEAELASLARSDAPLRALLCEIAAPFVEREGFSRLGFSSLSDWASERLGRSGRWVYDCAKVGAALRTLPLLREALTSGRLGFAKARLVARVAEPASEARWIALAERLPAEALACEVRRVDAGALESGGLERDASRAMRIEIACTPEGVGLWGEACRAARLASGRLLRISECAEVIAAEVVSALPLSGREETFAQIAVEWAHPNERAGSDSEGAVHSGNEAAGGLHRACAEPATSASAGPGESERGAHALSPDLAALREDLDTADAFELERRLREVCAREQRLCARIGPRLDHVLQRGVHLAFGYATRERYQRERLGMEPSSARRILRIERAAARSPVFAEAWRSGALTPLQADALVPLLCAELREECVERWIAHARGFALRRLRDDVEAALTLRACDFRAWLETAGLPESDAEEEGDADGSGESLEAGDNREAAGREIGAKNRDAKRDPRSPARLELERCRVTMVLESDVAQLFRGVLCSVRRMLERETQRPATPGEALSWISAHVVEAWGTRDRSVRRAHRIFARDGWRCAVPGCSKLRSLHAHHVVYRAQGGKEDGENLVTLCAAHHLRGVHGGALRIRGLAPHALRFELGIREGFEPAAIYASGDRRLQ